MQQPVRTAAFSTPALGRSNTSRLTGRVACAVSRRDQLAQHVLSSAEHADVHSKAPAAQPQGETQLPHTSGTSRRNVLTVGLVAVSASNILTSGAAKARGNENGWYDVPQAKDPKTIMITGASSGLGFAGAGKLAAAGHNLVLVCRTQEKAATACNNVEEKFGPIRGSVTPEACELGDCGDIRRFAERWKRTGKPIDVLCLNAGAQFTGLKEPKRTQEGFELTVGVNHLGHFLLEDLLQGAVEKSKQPRIVVTTSEVHDPTSSGGKVGPGATLGSLAGLEQGPAFDMVSGEKFDADKAYKDSKLCNALFMRQLDKRLRDQGSNITVNAFGPGLVTRTKFFRSAPSQFIGVFDFITNDVLGVAETVQGAGDCLAYMAVDPSLANKSGLYYNNEVSGTPLISPGHTFMAKSPSKEAQNDEEAKKLWDLSKKLVQV